MAEIIPFNLMRIMPTKGKRSTFHLPPCYKLLIMKKLILLSGVFLFPFITSAQQEQSDKGKVTKLDSIIVEANRAGKNTPFSWSKITSSEIRQNSSTKSVPMIVNTLPSVVTTTESGNALGYTYMRVRGSDGSRINVTLNGIALNDSESQEMFWVDLPALSSFMESMQLQRGVGTSTNGPGAFGASLNIQTLTANDEPYGMADFSAGSWNTFVSIFGAGTGFRKNGTNFDIRISDSHGNGYIRNSGGGLNSLFARGGLVKGRNYFTANLLYGREKTGIAWEGAPKNKYENDRRYNPSGEYFDDAGNVKYYDNETDNFTQLHLQLLWQRAINDKLTSSMTLNYTNGTGHYENYKADKKFSKYSLPVQVINGITYSKSDFIIRQYLKNDYFAYNASLSYNNGHTKAITGLSAGYYFGDHFGQIKWSKYNKNITPDFLWYGNDGEKSDLSLFFKIEQEIGEKLVGFADLQIRRITYSLFGVDSDLSILDHTARYGFFNPKFGFSYIPEKNSSLYFSVAVGHKEPGRSDMKDAIKTGRVEDIKSEKLVDIEAGYRFNGEKFSSSINIFMMEYKDQLVPTGKLSETGYVIKENIPESYRRGVEAELSWKAGRRTTLNANASLSSNKVVNYTMWTDLYDNPEDWNFMGQVGKFYKKSNLSYSPSIVSYISLNQKLFKDLSINMSYKYVGKQFYDNSSRDEFSIPSYGTIDMSIGKPLHIKKGVEADIYLFINNLANRKYFSNAWVYYASFEDNSPLYVEDGLFAQPGINYNIKFSLKF